MSIHNCNANKELRGGYKFEKGIQNDKNIKLSDSERYRATTAIQDWNLDEEYRTTKKKNCQRDTALCQGCCTGSGIQNYNRDIELPEGHRTTTEVMNCQRDTELKQ